MVCVLFCLQWVILSTEVEILLDDYLILFSIGNNAGFLYVFHLFDQSCEAVLVQHQKGHKYGISALAGPSDKTSEDVVASGDQDGNVIVWAVNRDHLHKDATFPSYGCVDK